LQRRDDRTGWASAALKQYLLVPPPPPQLWRVPLRLSVPLIPQHFVSAFRWHVDQRLLHQRVASMPAVAPHVVGVLIIRFPPGAEFGSEIEVGLADLPVRLQQSEVKAALHPCLDRQ
jgi:hypothetical protein